MNTTISNNGLPPFTPPTSGTNTGSAASAGTAASTPGSGSNVADQLKLTDSARALQAAASAGDGAVVDQHRVDQIRQVIASGNYVINPTHIAEQMLAFEQQLGGTGEP